MTLPAKTRALLLLLASPGVVRAQTKSDAPSATVHQPKTHTKAYQPPFNPDVVVIDPAHGGGDDGANLGKAGVEKDLNIAFAERLRDLLSTQGFTVLLTHANSSDNITADQRAELANRSRAVACLLLHATGSGQGVHFFTSALTSPAAADESRGATYIVPWDSAQAASLTRSLQLSNELSTSLNGMKIPLLVGSASVSPIDSLSCPAVAIELAPPYAKGNLADEAYQQHVAESIVSALTYWRQRAKDQIAAEQAAAEAADRATNGPAAQFGSAKPKPKPKPVIINSPDEMPLAPDTDTPKPAPIERKPPPIPPTTEPPTRENP